MKRVMLASAVLLALMGCSRDKGTNPVDNFGKTYSIQESGTTGVIRDIIFADSVFIAVGGAGVMKSTDGKSWAQVSIPVSKGLIAICRGDDAFVTVGAVGTILYSEDGTNWMNRSVDLGDQMYSSFSDVAWTGSQYIAVGYRKNLKEGTVWKSTDGRNWSQAYVGSSGWLFGVTSVGSTIIVVGENGLMVKSTNGTVWSESYLNTDGILSCAELIDGKVYLGGESTPLFSSLDGVTWSSVSISGDAFKVESIHKLRNLIFAVGFWNATEYLQMKCIYKSENGVDWSLGWIGESGIIWGAAYGNNRAVFVGHGDYGSAFVLTSP